MVISASKMLDVLCDVGRPCGTLPEKCRGIFGFLRRIFKKCGRIFGKCRGILGRCGEFCRLGRLAAPGAAAWPAATAVGPAALAAQWGGNVGIPKTHPGVKIRRNSVQNYAFFTEKTCKVCRFQPFAVPLSFDLPCHSVRWPTMVGQPLAWQGRYRTHFVFFRERCLSLPTLTFHFPIV